jgi:hypothetical protein
MGILPNRTSAHHTQIWDHKVRAHGNEDIFTVSGGGGDQPRSDHLADAAENVEESMSPALSCAKRAEMLARLYLPIGAYLMEAALSSTCAWMR